MATFSLLLICPVTFYYTLVMLWICSRVSRFCYLPLKMSVIYNPLWGKPAHVRRKLQCPPHRCQLCSFREIFCVTAPSAQQYSVFWLDATSMVRDCPLRESWGSQGGPQEFPSLGVSPENGHLTCFVHVMVVYSGGQVWYRFLCCSPQQEPQVCFLKEILPHLWENWGALIKSGI